MSNNTQSTAEILAEEGNASPLTQIPIEVTISVGKARPLVFDLLNLRQDSILPLDKRIEDPVELFVGERLIARGELQELDGDQQGQLAVCVTEVIDLNSGS